MSKDFEDYHRPSGGDGYRSNDFHSGLTEYRRPRGIFNRKSNPYRRSNMIYAKRKRRWPIIVLVIVIIAAICGTTAYACGAFDPGQAQGMAQEQTEVLDG